MKREDYYNKCPECGSPMVIGERECESPNCLYLAPEVDVSDWEEFRKRKQEAKNKEMEKINEDWSTYKNIPRNKDGKVLAHLKLEDAEKIVKIKSTIIKEGEGPTISLITSRKKKVHSRVKFNWVQWIPSWGDKAGGSEENYISKGRMQTISVPQSSTSSQITNSREGLIGTGTSNWPLGVELGLLAMKKGEIRIIECPPELAWGDKDVGHIPAFSFVNFKLELVEHREFRLAWGL
jgi:endogenous inhibitor of DNA gyrase (YacG/DUF329 family)